MTLLSSLSLLSFGNIGETKSNCVNQFFSQTKDETIECHIGKISHIYYSGIVPAIEEGPDHDFCGDTN